MSNAHQGAEMTPKEEQKHTDLLPCRVCGSANVISDMLTPLDGSDETQHGRCLDCQACAPLTAWNTRKADCHEELVAIINYAKEVLLINSAYQLTMGRKYDSESLAECAAKVDASLAAALARTTNHQEG